MQFGWEAGLEAAEQEEDQEDQGDQAEDAAGDRDLCQHQHDRDDDEKSDQSSDHVSSSCFRRG